MTSTVCEQRATGTAFFLGQIDQVARCPHVRRPLFAGAGFKGQNRRRVSSTQMMDLAGCAMNVAPVCTAEMAVARRAAPVNLALPSGSGSTALARRQEMPDLEVPDRTIWQHAQSHRISGANANGPRGNSAACLQRWDITEMPDRRLDRAIDGLFVHSTLYLSPSFKGVCTPL